jgi:hypothetical protein
MMGAAMPWVGTDGNHSARSNASWAANVDAGALRPCAAAEACSQTLVSGQAQQIFFLGFSGSAGFVPNQDKSPIQLDEN